MKTSLLAKARQVPGKKKVDPDRAELALAWAFGEVTFTQVNAVLGGKKAGNGGYTHLAAGLRDAFRLKLAVRS